MRDVRGAASGREGLHFAVGGGFGLVGIHSMNGLRWQQSGDVLRLTTNTVRYPKAAPSRLRIATLASNVLVLESLREAGGDYFAGEYRRDDAAAGRIEGRVTLPDRDEPPLPEGAALHVTLHLTDHLTDHLTARTGPSGFVASQTVPVGGLRPPLLFQLVYATSSIDSERPYAVEARLSVDGTPRFLTPAPVPVRALGPAPPVGRAVSVELELTRTSPLAHVASGGRPDRTPSSQRSASGARPLSR